MENTFMIFSVSEVSLIDFNQVEETSPQTLRKSLDGTKTFVNWKGTNIPSSVQSLQTKEGPYTYSQIITILYNSEWQPQQPTIVKK